jgi:hypothetical protein
MRPCFDFALLVLALALASCVPKAIVVAPIAPAVVKAAADVKAAAAGAKRVQGKVGIVHQQSQGIAARADSLVAETDRLRKLPGVPLDEFDALWILANDLKRETFAHEIQARETVVAADEGATLQAAAEKSTAEVVPLAEKTDAAVVELKTQIVKQADDASLGRALKGVFWMAVVVFVIGGILYLAVKLKPGIL